MIGMEPRPKEMAEQADWDERSSAGDVFRSMWQIPALIWESTKKELGEVKAGSGVQEECNAGPSLSSFPSYPTFQLCFNAFSIMPLIFLGPSRDEPRVFGLDKFNGDNFAEWSFKMENIFDHYDLLEVMEGTEKHPENDPEKSPWDFSTWLKKQGIRHSLTMPYSPAMNGIAERANRTLTETARGLLIEAGLPNYFWPDAVRHACVAKNRALTHMPGEPTNPKEAWEGPNGKEWKKASDEEMGSIIENDTLDLVNLPPGRKAISSKWLFKRKTDADGNIERYKSRLRLGTISLSNSSC
ncbi:hypothetical protein CLOP_g2018 [Closterium sp. NIES-67]|nr:hypothetical protein CLOP_g2018 [Closterium sp. NIES-67]